MAGGHKVKASITKICESDISRGKFRIALIIVALDDLEVKSADILYAYA